MDVVKTVCVEKCSLGDGFPDLSDGFVPTDVICFFRQGVISGELKTERFFIVVKQAMMKQRKIFFSPPLVLYTLYL